MALKFTFKQTGNKQIKKHDTARYYIDFFFVTSKVVYTRGKHKMWLSILNIANWGELRFTIEEEQISFF